MLLYSILCDLVEFAWTIDRGVFLIDFHAKKIRNVSYLERIIEVCQSGIVEYEGSIKNKMKDENVHRWE